MLDTSDKNFFNFLYRTIFVVAVICSCCQCTPTIQKTKTDTSRYGVNPAHLNALYEEKNVAGHEVGIVHIYAEYPDYHWVGDQDEGIACVDDASRAAVFYLRQYKKLSSKEDLHKATMLLKFLMTMQAENGYFYNFIWPDGSINKLGTTSHPVPTWWSWRSLWTFGEAIDVLGKTNKLSREIISHRDRLIAAMMNEKSFFSTKTDTAGGLVIPLWLPNEGATDQSAIILMGLSAAYRQNSYRDDETKKYALNMFINHIADGIMMMQIEDPGNFCDGAFLSWKNLWHAYANLQSYALLSASQALRDPHMESHALYEINTFYPTLYARGYLESFWIRAVKGHTVVYDLKSVPQIAYGIRPMVFACVKAYEITGDEVYKMRADELAGWFSGKNPAHMPMYDPLTGIGFDGLSGSDKINRNSGAESTIEALLSMQALEGMLD